MGFRFSVLLAMSFLSAGVLPVAAAEYEKSGAWVFDSLAVAADGDRLLHACRASTVSPEGTELVLSLEPAAGGGIDASMAVSNRAWALGDGPVRVGFDIGADHWVLPGKGEGQTARVAWTGDAALLTFIEDLASSSFAGLTGADGAAIAQFSLNGSRSAIEAMKRCAEAQLGQGLGAVFEARVVDGSNPF